MSGAGAVKPFYARVCCCVGCMQAELDTLGGTYRSTDRTLDTGDRVIKFFLSDYLKHNPFQLWGFELAGWSSCGGCGLPREIQELLDSRVRRPAEEPPIGR